MTLFHFKILTSGPVDNANLNILNGTGGRVGLYLKGVVYGLLKKYVFFFKFPSFFLKKIAEF